MSYSGMSDFIEDLERKNELIRIKQFVNPVLEMAEITDRVVKSEGRALLFENTGTRFPVLLNCFGSDRRMSMAMGRTDIAETGAEIEKLFTGLTNRKESSLQKLKAIPSLLRIAGYLPSYSKRKGKCQHRICTDPDIGILPVLKCWPYDAGHFLTLPMVHTKHPESGSINVGMYRMQVIDKKTTAMHWQRHKTGANHFEAWKRKGEIMPVSVALGGDPVYTYAAAAPLPENINEYILAGFIRQRQVKMVKCITNDIFVPDDADIILEGFVDPAEDMFWEGPFGDHTGFYSLADWYPKFHITCITHSEKAIYPATIVGIPPQEDAFIANATERLFLTPVKLTIQPEIEDFHMPLAGVAHNLLIVKIKKNYPGQGMKVISSLSGAGQMMFTKYIIVVNGIIEIRDYRKLFRHIFANTDMLNDLLFSQGPLDVLDHSSDSFSYGGKLGVDATIKHPEEANGTDSAADTDADDISEIQEGLNKNNLLISFNISLLKEGIPVLVISVDRIKDADAIKKLSDHFRNYSFLNVFRLIIVVDYTVDVNDLFMVSWQFLGNSDPKRDHVYLSKSTLLIDGTVKAFRNGGFARMWPNIVTSSAETISAVDEKWDSLGLGDFIASPSERFKGLIRKGNEKIIPDDNS